MFCFFMLRDGSTGRRAGALAFSRRSFWVLLVGLSLVLTRAAAEEGVPGSFHDPAAVREAEAGERSVVNAAWWGFKAKDATAALQAAINSKARKVIVPFMGAPWIIRPVTLRSDLELVFRPGVMVLAKKGEFRGPGDSLFRASDQSNIVVRGYGAVLRMRKSDYERSPYRKAEWRMGFSFTGCRGIEVEGLHIEDTGGDGIYIGSTKHLHWCQDVVIRDCVCRDNYRQGISIISAVHLLIENCTFSGTEGTAPEAGIDFEPNGSKDRLVDCTVQNSVFANNAGHQIQLYLAQMTDASRPISIRFENCLARLGEPGMKPGGFRERKQKGRAGIAIGKVRDHGPKGLIEFDNCTTENTGREAVYIYDKSDEGARVRFVDCVWKDSWVLGKRASSQARAPIRIASTDPAICRKPGGIDFDDCYVADSLRGAPVVYDDKGGGRPPRDVTGRIRVRQPGGLKADLGSHAVHSTLRLERWAPSP